MVIEPESDRNPEPLEGLDTSEDLDLVPLFSSDAHNTDMEVLAIQGVLDAGGIPAVIVGGGVIPSLPYEVRVPRAQREEALRLIAESQAVGPRGAQEAELASEGPE